MRSFVSVAHKVLVEISASNSAKAAVSSIPANWLGEMNESKAFMVGSIDVVSMLYNCVSIY